ncbi:nitrogenase molybdenum-iron protein alpha/beta subunit [Methanomicrobium sp. W14]|uniref:nitrogenase component 1 n=1 Tax=Methanomicrobium sp. W14 TaxID=2817839 RepID=UPI001AE4E7FE|nr:nitrogenase component 1 [Methanomicrobium sp. W14]MBP2134569.1 nitrogenase molybdenum-iron protein alpha/beta subunit [Methanomicrobium sp. W14]
MREACSNPLWPCAMTGAASALAGISDLGVIVNGSSGCYYYADMAIPDTLYSTFLVEDEVIFGTAERLTETVESVSQFCKKVAVINTCVPSIMGEDIKSILSDYDVFFVDAGGFKGDFDSGWKSACEALALSCNESEKSVNIEGICSLDPYYIGNLNEAKRLLSLADIPAGPVFFHDTYDAIKNPSCLSVSVNPDYNTGAAKKCPAILGTPEEVEKAVEDISAYFPESNPEKITNLSEETSEILTKAGDNYLRKNDPPRVAVFSTKNYTEFACRILTEYMDAEIVFAGARNGESSMCSGVKIEHVNSIRPVSSRIKEEKPDLLIGSSYEYARFPEIPFMGLTFPIRHIKMLFHRPLAGIEGSLYFLDSAINALESKKRN